MTIGNQSPNTTCQETALAEPTKYSDLWQFINIILHGASLWGWRISDQYRVHQQRLDNRECVETLKQVGLAEGRWMVPGLYFMLTEMPA